MKSKINLKDIIPNFELPASNGMQLKSWDYSQKKHLVIFILPAVDSEDCRAKLRDWARGYSQVAGKNAEILVIALAEKAQLSALARELKTPFPLLADAKPEVIPKFVDLAVDESFKCALFIVDKFGSLYFTYFPDEAKDLPELKEILEALDFIELECPECEKY